MTIFISLDSSRWKSDPKSIYFLSDHQDNSALMLYRQVSICTPPSGKLLISNLFCAVALSVNPAGAWFTDSVAFLPVPWLNRVLKGMTNCCCKNTVVVNVKMSEVPQRSLCACCLSLLALVPQLCPCPDLLLCLAFLLGAMRATWGSQEW